MRLVGLTRAFIYAGTPSVVASLWNVEDSSTAQLMASFYKNLKTMTKVEALRQAQLQLIKGNVNSDYSPAGDRRGRQVRRNSELSAPCSKLRAPCFGCRLDLSSLLLGTVYLGGGGEMNSIPLPSIPLEPDHLTLVGRKALEQQRLKRGVEILSEEVEERYRLVVGESAEMKHAVELAKKAASSRATVLLLGESGTGKEILARAISNWSERKDRPFIAIDSVGLSKKNCWRASCSAMNKARLPARTAVRRGKSNWLMAARSFSMRSATSPPRTPSQALALPPRAGVERVRESCPCCSMLGS